MPTGIVEPAFTVLEIPNVSASFVRAALPQNAPDLAHLYEERDILEGNLLQINAAPISQDYNGMRQFAFLDDFYFRVYLLPSQLDFGAIVSTATREVTVWNSYFTPVTLQSIVPQIGTEVTLGSTPSLPNSIPALTLRAWSFTVTTEGPPTLDEEFVWTFDTGETFNMPVTGSRSVLWPFLPNWSSPYSITFEYLTSVFSARSGREQRIAEREHPRVSLEFDILLTGERRREYRRLMAYWQDRPFLVADVSRNVASETVLAAGGTTVTVDDAPTWIGQEDRAVVLVSGQGERQQIGLRVIDNIDSDNLLTFKDTDGVDWPAGTRIYAGVVANLEDDKTMSRSTTNVMTGSVRFNVLPGTELVETPPLAPNTFNDKELFLFKPNWGESANNEDRHITDYVDYNVGRLSRFSPISYGTTTWTNVFLGRDSAGIQELLDVFKRMKGRQGEFYMPTWEDDLTAKLPLNGGSLGLRVEGLDTFNAYAADDTSRAVMVELVDGTRIFRVVDEIIEIDDTEGNDTLINMTTTWDETIEVEDIAMISWVRCWRFATDDLTAEFLTNSVANLQMSMQTLEDLPAESDESSNSP